MNTRSIFAACITGALFLASVPSADAAKLGTAVRSALSKGGAKVGPGTVDGVRAIGTNTVRIDMKTGKLTHPAGKDSYDLYQAQAAQTSQGVVLSQVQNIGATALLAASRSGKVAMNTKMIIGDATGHDLGEFSGKSVRIGTFVAGANGQVTHARNLLVVLKQDGSAARVIAEATKQKK